MRRTRPWIQWWFSELTGDAKVRAEVASRGHGLLSAWAAVLDVVEEGEGEASTDLGTLSALALLPSELTVYNLGLFVKWGWMTVGVGGEVLAPESVTLGVTSGVTVTVTVTRWKVRHGVANRNRQRKFREQHRVGSPKEKDVEAPNEPKLEVPVEELVAIWNEIGVSLGKPAVRKVNDRLATRIKTRWLEQPDLGYWRSVMERLRTAPACIEGKWCDFVWLWATNKNGADNHVSLMDGKYDRSFGQAPVTNGIKANGNSTESWNKALKLALNDDEDARSAGVTILIDDDFRAKVCLEAIDPDPERALRAIREYGQELRDRACAQWIRRYESLQQGEASCPA